MGKNPCFAQRRRDFPESGNPKCPVLGHEAAFSWARDPKMPCFGARKGVFLASGTQNGCYWCTKMSFSRSGTPKCLVLGYGRQAEKAEAEGERDDEAPGLRDNAAGIYEIRRLQRGHCGGLWGRPSSRPAVARAVPGAGRCPAGGTVNPHFRDRRGASPCAARHCSAAVASLFELRRFTSRAHRCAAP